MIKKDLKKARVQLSCGYGGYGVNADVYNLDGVILARIDIKELQEKLARNIRAGMFNFLSKKRKYQYITLK